MRALLSFIIIISTIQARGQFAPQVGQIGSIGIHKDSNIFIDWATNCSISRGPVNKMDVSLGVSSHGGVQDATLTPDGFTVSLGDGGEAVYYFENPIVDGPGYDFAVFENGFINNLDSNFAYSELAFVEVSNNGINYVRFPATSHTDTTLQVAGVGEYMDSRKIHNLAGKYIQQYGTPFDLNDLAANSMVQLDNIRYVRIKDVVGSIIPEFGTRDKDNHIINDPFPTPFASSGFDLDALGIIHTKYPVSATTNKMTLIHLFPNPAKDFINLSCEEESIFDYEIHTLLGQRISKGFVSMKHPKINIQHLQPGNYLLNLKNQNGKSSNLSFQKW